MSVNKLVRRVCTGAAASVLMIPLAQAAQLAVNDEAPLTIVSPGFSYITQTPGQESALSVTMDGYLFCANVGLSAPNIVKLAPGHSRWTLPDAFLKTTTYSGGNLVVNGGVADHSLACQVRGAQGEVFTPFSRFGGYIFRNGYEGKEPTQYWSMVNWQPVDGFDWSTPDWTQVPTDSCQFEMTPEDSPAVEESTLCAAATGVVQGGEFGTRSPKMWTRVEGSNFIYAARIDLRVGAQQFGGANEGFQSSESTLGGLSAVDFEVRDAYDEVFLDDAYTFCLLNALPATLSATTCNANPTPGSGIVKRKLTLDPETVTSLSRYLVVIRAHTGNYAPTHSPVAAVAVLSDPVIAREEQGDNFIGDNVIFGFYGLGFPWMTE